MRKVQVHSVSFYMVLLIAMAMFTLPASSGWSQTTWGYTQYLFNLYDINSAYAGEHGAGSFGVRYRSQWIGMSGAPETQYFSFHSPLMKGKLGVGVKLLNENIGARSHVLAKGSAAYKLKLNDATLSFALSAGVMRQGIDASLLKAYNQQDELLLNMPINTLTPVLDMGVFFKAKRFYLGVESCSINRPRAAAGEQPISRLYCNLSAVGGYMLPLQRGNSIHLSGLVRCSEAQVWQAELNAIYLIRNKIWLGGGYRFDSNAQAMACVNFTEQLRIGLSFDISTSAIKKFNDGSAEIFLGFNFKGTSGKSIRYF